MLALRLSLLWVWLCSVLAPITEALDDTQPLVIYKETSSGGGTDNTASILRCARKFMDLEYGTIRECDGGKICEDLPFEWHLNRSYQVGCVYMKKIRCTKLDPPLTPYDVDSKHFRTRLPSPFKVGSAVEISFTAADTEVFLVCGLISVDKGLIIVRAIILKHVVVLDSGLVSGKQDEVRNYNQPFMPYRKHTLTLRMMTDDIIDIEADGAYYTSFDTTGGVATAEVRQVAVAIPSKNEPTQVHSITFLSE